MRKVRGNEISMIFQDPMTSLNPVHTIGRQLIEAVQLHEKSRSRLRASRALEMVKAVGSRGPSAASTTTRTSSRAACASA